MAQSSRLKALSKEPLIHFLGGALLVFGFFWASGTDRDPADYAIAIDETDIARLEAGWAQNFRRAPTEAELDGLINQHIAEEIYYREALRLGLDKNDPVIRRRLFTKMRFLDAQDTARAEPSEAELKRWVEDNAARYAVPAAYDFEQIYLGQNAAPETASKLRQQLNQREIQPEEASQPLSLPKAMDDAETSAITRLFGQQFADGIAGLEPGQWEGPVRSGFGAHLVKITAATPGRPAVLEDIRGQVENDWRAARNTAEQERALANYRSQYDIVITGRE